MFNNLIDVEIDVWNWFSFSENNWFQQSFNTIKKLKRAHHKLANLLK